MTSHASSISSRDRLKLNETLAERGARYIQHFQLRGPYPVPDRIALAWLINNLQHWANREDIDFQKAVTQANYHYLYETGQMTREESDKLISELHPESDW